MFRRQKFIVAWQNVIKENKCVSKHSENQTGKGI